MLHCLCRRILTGVSPSCTVARDEVLNPKAVSVHQSPPSPKRPTRTIDFRGLILSSVRRRPCNHLSCISYIPQRGERFQSPTNRYSFEAPLYDPDPSTDSTPNHICDHGYAKKCPGEDHLRSTRWPFHLVTELGYCPSSASVSGRFIQHELATGHDEPVLVLTTKTARSSTSSWVSLRE